MSTSARVTVCRRGRRRQSVDSDELRLRIAERRSETSKPGLQAALTVESNRAQQRSLSDRGFISKAAGQQRGSAYVTLAHRMKTAQRTQMDIAKAALAETTLTSPISGIIAKRTVEPGERWCRMPVFTILVPHRWR